MEEEKNKKQPEEIPSVKKIVDCPRCKAKIEVEFEIDLEAVMPGLGRTFLPVAFPPKDKEDK